jgi:predicted RNA-binding Zn ribbon-like protein
MQRKLKFMGLLVDGTSERIGDHPVLEFLNTVPMVDGVLVDTLQCDEDVLRIMAQLGWPVPKEFEGMGRGKLLREVRELREEVRGLVSARKAGKRLSLGPLNAALAQSRNVGELVTQRDGSVALRRVWEQQSIAQILGPIADTAATFLAEADFDLVRRCEGENCVLWFYDRTKSHRRRWCSMAQCGNRHKVTAFRKRQS